MIVPSANWSNLLRRNAFLQWTYCKRGIAPWETTDDLSTITEVTGEPISSDMTPEQAEMLYVDPARDAFNTAVENGFTGGFQVLYLMLNTKVQNGEFSGKYQWVSADQKGNAEYKKLWPIGFKIQWWHGKLKAGGFTAVIPKAQSTVTDPNQPHPPSSARQ